MSYTAPGPGDGAGQARTKVYSLKRAARQDGGFSTKVRRAVIKRRDRDGQPALTVLVVEDRIAGIGCRLKWRGELPEDGTVLLHCRMKHIEPVSGQLRNAARDYPWLFKQPLTPRVWHSSVNVRFDMADIELAGGLR